MIQKKDVERIAHLAHIHLTQEETAQYQKDLSSIFSTLDTLKSVDTQNIPPTYQVTGNTNILRNDDIEQQTNQKELLDCSLHPKHENQICIPSVTQ